MDAAVTLALRLFNAALITIISYGLAHLLPQSEYGAFALANSWLVVFGIVCTFGMDRLLVRELAKGADRGDWNAVASWVRGANSLVGAASLIVVVTAALVFGALYSPPVRETVLLGVAAVPFVALGRVRQGALQAFGRVAWSMVPELLVRPVLGAAMIGLVLVMRGPARLTAAVGMVLMLAATGVSFLVGVYLLNRWAPPEIRNRSEGYPIRRVAAAGIGLLLFGAVWAANSQIGLQVIASLRGPAPAGAYDLAVKAAELVSLLTFASSAALSPTYARFLARNDAAGLQPILSRSLRWVAALSLLAGGLLLAIAWFAFPLVGPGYVAAFGPLAILLVGQMAYASLGPAALLLIMGSHQREAAVGITLGALANFALSVPLVHLVGINGAALAWTLSMVVWSGALAVRLNRLTGLRLTPFGGLKAETL